MTVRVDVYVEDIADRLTDFTVIRLYRDTSPTGSFGTLVTTITLVAAQEAYSYEDASGDALSWYRYDFKNTSTLAQSDPSAPFRAGGTTLASARLSAAARAGAAFRSACTAVGNVAYLVDDGLRDQGTDTAFLAGTWIRRPNAADSDDLVHRCGDSPFTVASARLAPVRAWANAPALNEVYEVFGVLPPSQQPGAPYSWDQAVREGLLRLWYVDQIIVGEGTGGVYEFDLGAYPAVRSRYLRDVLVRTTDSSGRISDVSMMKNGRRAVIREDGPSRTLVLSGKPATGQQVIAEVNRRADAVYQDDDFIPIDEEIVAAAAVVAAYSHLNRATPTKGRYTAELDGAMKELDRLYEPPSDVVIEG